MRLILYGYAVLLGVFSIFQLRNAFATSTLQPIKQQTHITDTSSPAYLSDTSYKDDGIELQYTKTSTTSHTLEVITMTLNNPQLLQQGQFSNPALLKLAMDSDNVSNGITVRNGMILNDKVSDAAALVMGKDGSLSIQSQDDIDVQDDSLWQVYTNGTTLFNQGQYVIHSGFNGQQCSHAILAKNTNKQHIWMILKCIADCDVLHLQETFENHDIQLAYVLDGKNPAFRRFDERSFENGIAIVYEES